MHHGEASRNEEGEQPAGEADSGRTVIYALAIGAALGIGMLGASADLQSSAISAAATISLALLALTAFITAADSDYARFTPYAKAAAAGLALPVAVVTSSADLNWAAMGAVIAVAITVASFLIVVKIQASKARSNRTHAKSESGR